MPAKISALTDALSGAKGDSPHFGEVRQIGLIAAIDLVDVDTGSPLDWRKETGAKICRRARAYGLLTRPIRDTLVLMPPLCVTETQIRDAVGALVQASADVLGK